MPKGLFALLLAFAAGLDAQAPTRANMVETLAKKLADTYVFADLGQKMAASLREKLAHGEYSGPSSPEDFSKTITAQLFEIAHDKHLRVMTAKNLPPVRVEAAGLSPQEQFERVRRLNAPRNFGFEKVERLPGNVGYLDLRIFLPTEVAGETAVAAMNFLANTDALIIDLRKNGGGNPAMIDLLCSYLFRPGQHIHLNDFERRGESLQQFWTLPYVPGKTLAGKDVYILTSKRTFSAAEEFVYDLKILKRATIVGETTGGGANPGGVVKLDDDFAVFIPTGRAINPVTKTNWEGEGIQPDIPSSADTAPQVAQLTALKKLAAKDVLGTPPNAMKDEIAEAIASLEKQVQPH